MTSQYHNQMMYLVTRELRWSTDNFHGWLYHSLKSFTKHLTWDQNSLFATNHDHLIFNHEFIKRQNRLSSISSKQYCVIQKRKNGTNNSSDGYAPRVTEHFGTGIGVDCISCKEQFYRYIPGSKVRGANMGPSGAVRNQVGPMLAPWTLLFGMSFRTISVEAFRCNCSLLCMKILTSRITSLKGVLKINVVHSLINQVQLIHKPLSNVYSLCNWVVTNHSNPYRLSHNICAQLFLLCYILLNLPVFQVFIWLIPHILQFDTTGIVIIV